MDFKYSFGIPGPVIWTTHIIIAVFLAYVGYNLLNKKKINQTSIIGLIVLGVLAFLYHAHLFYVNTVKDDK